MLVEDDRIAAVGPNLKAPADARIIELPGETLMPGMIEGHGHLFLHAYNETSWDDQVLHEPLALRTARAVAQAKATLMAGFTSERDLGTEGAGYADVGLKQAIEQGIVPGPRMMVATRAIVAKGAYGPKGYEPGLAIPQGAEEASGVEDIVRVVRSQIAAGADVVKLYGDYRWRPGEDSRPTPPTAAEMKAATLMPRTMPAVPVAVHTVTAEGMRRAIAAGVETIEHGDDGTPEIFKAMPTTRAWRSAPRWRRIGCAPRAIAAGMDPEPALAAVAQNRQSFQLARASRRCALRRRRCPGRVSPRRERSRNGADGRRQECPPRRC